MNHTQSDIERFIRLVDVLPCGCWYWLGARSRGKGNRKYYGTFRVGGKSIRAHRFAAEALGGKTCPKGFHRDHTCQFSMCVNPAHIQIVSHAENQRLKISRKAK